MNYLSNHTACYKKSAILLFAFCLGFTAIISYARETNLGDVTIRFCNDKTIAGGSKSLELFTQTNKEEDICLYMNNAGSTPVKLGINFVDGSITPDEEAKRACEPEGVKEIFGQYVKAEDTEFLVPAGGTLQTNVKLKFPAGVAGKINGCVTYNILDQSLSGDGMFKVFSRRANFIDVIVSGDVNFNTYLQAENNPSFPNLTKNDKVSLYKDSLTSSLTLKSYIINSGNLTSSTHVSGSVQGWFGLLTMPLQAKKINTSSKKKSTFEYDLPKRTTIAGPLKIQLNVQHEPVFPEGFKKDISASIEIIELQQFMLSRRIYVIVGAVVLVPVINRKKHVQKK